MQSTLNFSPAPTTAKAPPAATPSQPMITAKTGAAGAGGPSPAAAAKARAIFESLAVDGVITEEAFVEWFVDFTADMTSSKKREMIAAGSPEAAPAPVKKAKTTAGVAAQAPAAAPKADSKKQSALVKALVTSLKKSIKAKKFYSCGGVEECAGEAVMSPDEFHAIFGAVGTVPADHKPTSVVMVKDLNKDAVDAVFGAAVVGLSAQTYSMPRSFCKQYKTGMADLTITGAHVAYSKNTSNCKVKFTVKASAGSGGDDDSDDDIFGRGFGRGGRGGLWFF